MDWQILLPKEVKMITDTLARAGFEAYVVGGCVRDALLGKEPKDWDITTSALPEEVKKLFRRTVDTGIEHGTVTVLIGKTGCEVTTYRIDGEYRDGRHPTEVTFTPSLTEDLKRRDFTINAMAYSQSAGLVDCFGGREDLQKGIIRCVGDPEERFLEDGLRILRAVRFSAQLDFSIEPCTKRAMKKLSGNLKKISAERIREELHKLLLSEHPEKLKTAYETGITREVLPEWDRIVDLEQKNPCHRDTVGEHTLKVLMETPSRSSLRWAALFHDMGKAETKTTDEKGQDHFYGHGKVSAQIGAQIMARLKFDNCTRNQTVTLVRYHDYPFQTTKQSVRKVLSQIGPELFSELLELMRADTATKAPECRKMYFEALKEVRRMWEEIQRDQDCVTLKQLAVKGQDLIDAGVRPGKRMGQILHQFLELVIEEPEKNEKAYLLSLLKEMKGEERDGIH